MIMGLAANDLAGIASLVTSVLLVPTIMSLRKIASSHETRLNGHDAEIKALRLKRKRK